jgi:hypothetical protein
MGHGCGVSRTFDRSRVSLTIFISTFYKVKISMTATVTTTTVTLAPATATLILAANPGRTSLLRSVSGANPCTFKFQTPPAGVTDGLVLDNSTSQGGRQLITGPSTPVDAIYGFSTLGTTVCVEVGTFYGS